MKEELYEERDVNPIENENLMSGKKIMFSPHPSPTILGEEI
jgi:hypothetical protein